MEVGSHIGKRAIDDGARGRAFDCYGDKEHPKLIAADSEEWDFKGKARGAAYKANEEFMGWTDKTTQEIEAFGDYRVLGVPMSNSKCTFDTHKTLTDLSS